MQRYLYICVLCLLNIAFVYPKQINTSKDSLKSNSSTKPVRIYNTARLSTEKPKIDGVLDDACWQTGDWSSDFTQWIPNEGAKPSQPTFLKIFYDDQNVYVAIRAFDNEPDKIERKAGRRDELSGDATGICFDSYHDHRTGFEFDLTAAGQKVDLMLTNPYESDFNWNAVWYGKVGREDSAWIAEFEIPLSQLRYSSEEEQVWGIHVWRWINRLQEESDWEVQSLTGPGMLYLFGELHGIKGLKKSRRIEIMPYGSAKLNTFRKEPENPFASKGRSALVNGGLDAKIGVSSNFTLNLTLNPDFGQVESDPSVMNLTAFETFYAEKRPFFLEGKNIFDYDVDDASIFYSRRIGHAPTYTPDKGNGYLDMPENTTILSAEKFSGKTAKGLSVGMLHSLTATEIAKVHTDAGDKEYTAEPLTNYFVGRIQKDFNNSNTVLGGIFTSTNRTIRDSHLNFMNRDAFTGGVDLLHQWKDKEYYLKANIIGSSIQGKPEAIRELQNSSARYYQRPDAGYLTYDTTLTSLSGFGGKIKIGKGSKGLLRYSTELSWRSPGLDLNDIGFMQMADMVNQATSISYFVNKPVSIFRTYTISFSQANHWNFNLDYLSSGASLRAYMEFLNKWGITALLNYTGKSLDPRILRGGYTMKIPALWEGMLNWRTDYSKKIYYELNAQMNMGENNSLRYFSVSPGVTVRPSDNLKIGLNAQYATNKNELQYVDTAVFNSETHYIFGAIDQKTAMLTFRIDYIITPELSIQYYGSPFATVGKFRDFKMITNARADDFENRYQLLSYTLDEAKENYRFDLDGNNSPDITKGIQDFNFNQFRSNLVFRWEFRPGSQLYVVWSNERTDELRPGDKPINTAPGRLWNSYPNNIFMLKFNYWFSI